MDSPAPTPRCIRFGVFEIYLKAGEVRKSRIKRKLQEQRFQVLVTLLDKPGEVVARKKLREGRAGTSWRFNRTKGCANS
jgi:DNA-binding winged helix-turn-helix (wHTH) protein